MSIAIIYDGLTNCILVEVFPRHIQIRYGQYQSQQATVTLGGRTQTTAWLHAIAEKIKTTADFAEESFLCV